MHLYIESKTLNCMLSLFSLLQQRLHFNFNLWLKLSGAFDAHKCLSSICRRNKIWSNNFIFNVDVAFVHNVGVELNMLLSSCSESSIQLEENVVPFLLHTFNKHSCCSLEVFDLASRFCCILLTKRNNSIALKRNCK